MKSLQLDKKLTTENAYVALLRVYKSIFLKISIGGKDRLFTRQECDYI